MRTLGLARRSVRTAPLFAILGSTPQAPSFPLNSPAAVVPTVEADPSHHRGDTADDVAIWVHPTDASLSLVIGDDNNGGLMVWGLDGKELQYVEGTN